MKKRPSLGGNPPVSASRPEKEETSTAFHRQKNGPRGMGKKDSKSGKSSKAPVSGGRLTKGET